MSSVSRAAILVRRLDGRGGSRLIDAGSLREGMAADGPIWVDIDLNSSQGRSWVRSDAALDKTTVDSLLAAETRPRAIATPKGLLIVLRGVNLNPGADPEDMVAVRLWLDRERVITSRHRGILSVQDVAEALDAGSGPATTGAFLVCLIARLTDRIGKVVEEIEEEIDDIELGMPEGEVAELRARLSGLRRQIASIRRFLAPQRDALDRLYRQPGEMLSDFEIQDLREEADRLTRCLEDLDLVRERALVTQEELMQRVAEEQNQRVYVLSIVAAIFLPVTFVTGLLGMNVAGLPGTEVWYGFAASVAAMLVLGIGLTAFFRWKGWL